jgi:hypothetical protein
MGPISYAYCRECLSRGLEPYGGIIAYIADNIEQDKHPKECLAEWAHATIERSLEAAGRTWEDLKEDCLSLLAREAAEDV